MDKKHNTIEEAKKQMDDVLAKISSSAEQRALRPRFHFASPCGWINDPNGFSFFSGQFHLFAQWNPYSIYWDNMHWCHAVTKDLVRWEFLPPALAPDTEADKGGCFSGSAIEHEGRMAVVYTGLAEYGSTAAQNQCLAFYDGKTFEKSERNAVITAADIPFEYVHKDFRDPKIWREDGRCFLAAGIRKTDGRGAVAVFEAADFDGLERWQFKGIADEETTLQSGMWECPDLFSLGGKDVLIFSPMAMEEDKVSGINKGNNTVYLTGTFDRQSFKFARERQQFTMLDLGIDFYAAQTMLAPDGRRLMVAWMQNWDSYITPENYLWSGMMTFPRELCIKDGQLFQTPARELEQFYGRKETGEIAGGSAGERTFALRHCAAAFEIKIEAGECAKFALKIGEEQFALAEFDSGKMELMFSRENTACAGAMSRKAVCVKAKECRGSAAEGQGYSVIKLHCLIDTSSVEVFINGGEAVFSNTFFIPGSESTISVSSAFRNAVLFEFNEIDV